MRGIGAILLSVWSLPVAGSAETVRIDVLPTVLVPDVRRVGVNLGTWHSWGAEQLGQNVLQNPGFEGMIDRAVVMVRGTSAAGFTDSESWVGREDGFWRGATFDVRTGAAAGTQGEILDSRRAGADGYPLYTPAVPVPALTAGDVVSLTRIDDSGPPERWNAGDPAVPVRDDVRPGSPGRRSLALVSAHSRPAEAVYYLDAIGNRAGKLLPIDGPWRLAFWSRADGSAARLRVRFARQGSAPFVDREIFPTDSWSQTVLEFTGNDSGPAGTLELRFRAQGDGRVLLDDAELEARDDPPGAFRAQVLAALQRLHPGYLRDWPGAQGWTLENRLADAFGRRVTRTSPSPRDTFFEYGLREYLDLCRAVGANPWIVVPTTFSDLELKRLGRFLAMHAARDRFDDVVVEFGNENWNPLSRPAGIPQPRPYGAAAERAFRFLREGAAPLRLRTAVNGQFVNPRQALAFATATPDTDVLAVAPYWLFNLPAGLNLAQRLRMLFADESSLFAALHAATGSGKPELAVYEVNLHTTGGDAPAGERDPTVAGAAAGTALARRILQAQAAGARRQCAYELAGYEMFTDDRRGFVKLWGLVRDLGPTQRLRPTGLAVALLNRVTAGDRYETRSPPSASDLTVAAYRSADGWSAVIASERTSTAKVEIAFPPTPSAPLPVQAHTLVASDPWVTNEDGENVHLRASAVTPRGSVVEIEVPPVGLVAIGARVEVR